jgi:hypothetical protein
MFGTLSKLPTIQTPEVLRRQRWILLFAIPVAVGALAGIFVLHPLNEFVYYHEHQPPASSARAFVISQLWDTIRLRPPIRTALYAGAGTALGLLTALMFNALYTKARQIQQLSAELEKDLRALIRQGESGVLEFKSTLRWDLKQGKVNRALEAVVVKTLAGFMNADGGTLLVGVADDGEIVGLERDYQTLKKQNRDGFEQAIMGAVAAHIGTDSCRHLHVVFHDVDGKDICRVITRSSAKPVFIKKDDTAMFYLRTGGGTRRLNVEEAVDYIADRWSD